MALPLNAKNKSLSKQIAINPQVVLQIEGLETVFGVQPVLEFLRWDTPDARWDEDLHWDGLIEKAGSKAVIDLSQGTTNNITQQILPDKGGSGSVSTMNVQLIDVNNEVAQILSFDNMTEVLGKKCDLYLGYKQGAYPDDFLPIFRGVIVDFYTADAVVMVTIAHPESLKRQSIYQLFQNNLNGGINNSTTTIVLNDTTGLIPNADASSTYIRIDDEIMNVVSIDSSTNLTVVRGQEDTIQVAHDDDAEVTSIYNLSGSPIDLALKIMLSDEDNLWFNSDDLPKSINFITATESIADALIFDYYDIQELTGLFAGDSIRLTGTNAGTYTIKGFGTLDSGSYIQVNESLIDETEFAGTFEYRSQYNVLPDGLGMLPNQVDVDAHIGITRQFPSNFVDYSFFLTDTVDDVKEFIDKQIYFPQGLYQIPRKARSSVKIITPPFSSEIVPTINDANIKNITKLRQRRSLHKYLYNIIRYDYEVDVIQDKSLVRDILINTESLDRIKGGRKQLVIESQGLRRSPSTTNALGQITQRMVDRYKFAPTYFEGIEVKYSDGFVLEVGDVLPFGGGGMQVVDLQTGKRNQGEQLFEVINKSLNIKTGAIKITLLSTGFSIDSRNAVASLAAGCGNNSTTTRIELVNIVDTGEYSTESEKWEEFAGQKVRVFKKDYTEDEEATLVGVDASNEAFLVLDSALSFTPTSDHLIEIPEYDNTSKDNNATYKLRFAHYSAKATVTTVTSSQIFDVDDASKLLEGSKIVVSSADYTDDSFGTDFTIANITGNKITLDSALPFTPAAGFKVERSNFLDEGAFYGII